MSTHFWWRCACPARWKAEVLKSRWKRLIRQVDFERRLRFRSRVWTKCAHRKDEKTDLGTWKILMTCLSIGAKLYGWCRDSPFHTERLSIHFSRRLELYSLDWLMGHSSFCTAVSYQSFGECDFQKGKYKQLPNYSVGVEQAFTF